MPQPPPPRIVDELLLVASDVAVVDRATLSLWHCQQLLRPHLAPSPPDDKDDKENGGPTNQETVNPPVATAASVELDDGMAVAAVAFAAAAEPSDAAPADEPQVTSAAIAAAVGGSHRVQRVRRASITESEISVDDEPDAVATIANARLSMATKVAVIYRRYRCVLCLDASPSSLSIDVRSGKVFLDMLYESVELFVRNLLQPIEVGGAGLVPEFHISVMVQGAYVESLCVLVQGFVLDVSNADRLLQLVRERLTLLEDDWAAAARAASSADGFVNTKPGHRASLSSMLQNAVFALNSLPSGAAPLIVLATDGVVDLLNAYTYDSLVMQLVRHDIQCHFLRIGGAPWNDPHASFGFVPDVDLLQFVAQTSGGSVVEYVSLHQSWAAPPIRDSVKCMSTFQHSLFVRPSKIQAISAPVLQLDMDWCASYDGTQYMPLRPYRMWREKVHEYRIQTDVQHIVEARIREGFAVNKVHVRMMQRAADGSLVKMPVAQAGSAISADVPSVVATKVLLVFVLQWKQNVWLEYVISSTIENQPHVRISALRSTASKTVGGISGNSTNTVGHGKKDLVSTEWYVKVNVLADGEFLRSFEDCRSNSQGRQAIAGAPGAPITLHEFIRHVQDVDRVLLHLMTAAASVINATDSASHFSFGSQVNHNVSTPSHLHHTTNKSQASHPVFGIIGELSPVLWHRWFHVDRFEVLAVVVDDPSPQTFYPHRMQPQVIPRNSAMHPGSRSRQNRRAGMSLEPNVHPLLVGRDFTGDRIRGALLRWSSHRLGKDLFLRFLSADSQRADDRSKHASTAPTVNSTIGKRRQQRASLNSATLAAQINASMEQAQLLHKREEPSRGALCFVRVEAKNHTLVVIHVAFFSASASIRRETLVELKNIVVLNDSPHAAPQANVGGVPTAASPASVSRRLVLCHRMLSRLLVTHDTLVLEDTENLPESSLDPDKPMVACCGGSELQLRSVFGAFMWHSSWKWRLSRSSNASLMEVMRHLHEARIRAGFWILDWNLEEDGDSMRTASVIFGREVLMEDENGHLKTSLIQYGITRTADNCLLTSFWMEPQYGYAKTTLARDATVSGHQDSFLRSLRHAVGHDLPLSELVGRSVHSTPTQNTSLDDPVGESQRSASSYLDEGKLLALIREFIFDSDRHLLSCLHTFETVTSVQEGGIDVLAQRYTNHPVPGIIGAPVEAEEHDLSRALVPAFSTARLLESSKRSSEHFLMYLERGVSLSPETTVIDSVPTLSPANIYLYSMLERTLRSLSDCEVAWTDFNGRFVGDTPDHSTTSYAPTISSQLPLWFLQSQSVNGVQDHRPLSNGRCFAKLLPNETVLLAFLPAITTLAKKRRPLLSPIDSAEKNSLKQKLGMARWHETQKLKATVSMETGQLVAAQSSMLKMSVSADDIVLYQERRQSFREGYKSWRMGHFQGAKDDKTHRAGHGGQLSPHPKVASFSEDYEFCESICRDADIGCDFHLLIEKADGELGSGYFQVAFYECSLAQLSETLTTEPFYGQKGREQLLSQLFARVSQKSVSESIVENNRIPPLNKRTPTTAFGSRAGSAVPPSPLSIPVEPAREEPSINLAVLHSSMTFRKKVKRAHEHNFSRGVYVSLRDGAPVQQSDLIQALSSCVEVPMDMDITLLYRMLQVDMIRETVPRSALRSSMIDMLSGKPIRDALKERLDKSLEGIISTVFHGIADTKYFVFVGSENMAVDDVVGVADADVDSVQLLVEEDGVTDGDGVPSKPPRLVKSITIATGTAGFSNQVDRDVKDVDQVYGETVPEDIVGPVFNAIAANGDMTAGIVEGSLNENEDQHQQQINQEEDAELNKDVAAATSSFSSPFFFRFECRELLKELPSRPRSTSSGVNNLELTNPASKSALQRSASSKSFLDPLGNAVVQASSAVLPTWQRHINGNLERADGVRGSTGGISEIAEWAATLSGPKIALRLVTLTLPNEQLLERTRGHHIGVDVDDKRRKVTSTELFSSLPFFQRQVLKRMRKSIKEWSSMEILGILRNVECITPAIAQLVQKLFRDLPDTCRTTVKYPVAFVNVHHESVDPMALLEKELRIGTESLRLVECGGLYFVVKQLSDESFKVPYWAFLSIDDGNIVLNLHHEPPALVNSPRESSAESFDRLEVLTSLHLAVNSICKRVNQFLLLLQLHETRSCNELLIPADPGTSSVGPPSPTSVSNRRHGSSSSLSTFFWPGQFECDRKYAAFFRLNERMVPSIALTTLCTQALEQFQVHNRRHVFVYRDRGGHVFYMKMSVATSDAVNQPTRPSLQRANSNGSPGGGSPSGILLEVFGVCCAGEEVTQELCKLLERKLDETMQLILMKLLARNTKFQLSPSDMAFMCPPGARPASSTVYKVPNGLVPRSDASTALLFLCQTLGMTSYMRQINSSAQPQFITPTRYERQSSSRSTTSSRIGRETLANADGIEGFGAAATSAEMVNERMNAVDPSKSHPALIGTRHYLEMDFSEGEIFDSTTTSPVFFLKGTRPPKDTQVAAPLVLGDATFAVNLNSELRLSPGFLSRVGKGLAVLKVEVLHCDGDDTSGIMRDGGDIVSLDLGEALGDVSTDEDHSSTLYIRCQLWTRGPIQVPALRAVYESHVRESLCDYAIEAVIRDVHNRSKVVDGDSDVDGETNMPAQVSRLLKLLGASAQMSSSSVTKLALPVAIRSWDVGCIASQAYKYLGASLPLLARPAVFATQGSQLKRMDPNDLRSHEGNQVRLIPIPPTIDSVALANGSSAPAGLVSSESIQSEMSEIDSVSSFRHSVGSSTIESLSSASLLGSSTTLGFSKEFTTSELMFHSMAKGAGSEMAKNASPPVVQQRSFYYVIDVSITGGLVFHGYNMSHQVVDAIATHLARVMTWSLLRDQLLQSLLLQRGGVGYAAPSGASVVQPRLLLVNAGALNATDFTVNYVTFQTSIVPILQAFDTLPKSVDTTGRLDISQFGKLLKELGVQVVEKGELQRSRSRNAASGRLGAEDLTNRTGSMRSGIVSSSNSQRSMTGPIEKPPTPKPGGAATVPSPTKRGSTGGLTPALSIGPSINHQGGGSSAVNAARMRSNPTAANALMAARARARGGGFPGKMGGGPGVGSSRAAGEVAPWDLPVTNTKTASTAGSAKTLNKADSASFSTSQTPALGRSGSNGVGSHSSMVAQKRPSGSKTALAPLTSSARSSSDSKDTTANAWRSVLAQTWGPHYKYCAKNAFVQSTVAVERTKGKESDDPTKVKMVDPLRYYGAAFQRQQQLAASCLTASDNCLGLFRRIQEITPETGVITVTDDKSVQAMMQTGHVMFHQRFRVSYIERWEIVKIDDEYVEDGSNTGRLRALQASMDLVNLLSYKQEFVFTGNERVVAKLLTEHTVQAMCGKEGQAVREMKLQILKAVFHSRMDVVQRFFDQYAAHLCSLGFHHLQMSSSRMGQKQPSTTSLIAANSSSASGSGSVTPTRSSVDAFASEGEAFSEFFVHSGGIVRKSTGRRTTPGPAGKANDVLLLELKCDYTGVQVSVVLVNEEDLRQQQLGHQRHLDPAKKVNTRGALVQQVSQSLRDSLNTRMLIHDFTIRFFHRCLLDWTWRKPDGSSSRPTSSPSSLHNMVKGVRCFLRSYPYSVSDKSNLTGTRECALEASTVELPVRNLQSDFSESILVKILLRYIACHGSRYDVTDLTQFGTPDTIACHSAAGNFFSRQGASSSSSSWSRPGATVTPGYSLLITTQELWKGKKRPKTSVLLALVRSAPPSAILLPTDRAMHEAELFVKELFRAAAANYERDLLWSRLLHNDSQGPSADVAHALSLPVEHFRVEVGPQQLEECLRLSVCIPLDQIDPDLSELLEIEDVCWQEFALRLRDVYAGQVREYQFEGQAACHFLLLCPDARDLMIHLTFPSGITNATLEREANRVHIDICRREEPANHKFSLPQRRAITDFVNNVVHWLWRCLLYD